MLGLVLTRSASAGWFGNHDHEQLIQTQQELAAQRHTNGNLVGVILVLGVGCTVLFGIGAAIGSKVRKEVRKKDEN
jgi:hypothetical protein